jgi:hypothetical protein
MDGSFSVVIIRKSQYTFRGKCFSKRQRFCDGCKLEKKQKNYLKAGKAKKQSVKYAHNVYDEKTHNATSTINNEVWILDPADCPDMMYLIPCPKSPHGTDVDPTGEYIVASGKTCRQHTGIFFYQTAESNRR